MRAGSVAKDDAYAEDTPVSAITEVVIVEFAHLPQTTTEQLMKNQTSPTVRYLRSVMKH